MGFMDLFMKGLKKAAEEIDKKAGLTGDSSLGNFANKAQQSYDQAVGNTTSSAAAQTVKPSTGKTTPANVLASGSQPIGAMKTVKNEYADIVSSFEIPESFTEFNSHAEPEMCHLYMFDESDEKDININKPIICITPEKFAYNAVASFRRTGTVQGMDSFELVNCGKMLFKAKNRNYSGKTIYFYGFCRGDEAAENYMGLATIYCHDVEGTPLEAKLISVLDHAAQTYSE